MSPPCLGKMPYQQLQLIAQICRCAEKCLYISNSFGEFLVKEESTLHWLLPQLHLKPYLQRRRLSVHSGDGCAARAQGERREESHVSASTYAPYLHLLEWLTRDQTAHHCKSKRMEMNSCSRMGKWPGMAVRSLLYSKDSLRISTSESRKCKHWY